MTLWLSAGKSSRFDAISSFKLRIVASGEMLIGSDSPEGPLMVTLMGGESVSSSAMVKSSRGCPAEVTEEFERASS